MSSNIRELTEVCVVSLMYLYDDDLDVIIDDKTIHKEMV